jgi:precorrin-3B synthase
MNAHLRRGVCPGLSQAMATGDGLLARITSTGATISCDAFRALCAAARRCGNGVIEVTSRGSIQIRGLTKTSAEGLAHAVARIKVPLCEGPAILNNPLAGLDPDEVLDTSVMAAELRRAISAAPFSTEIAPKVSVALDGGGALHLDAVPADVRMWAEATYVHIALGGDADSATPLGAIAAEHAVRAAMNIMRVIAATGPAVRARDIVAADGAAAFRHAIADMHIDRLPPPRRAVAEAIGTHSLRDGSVAIGLRLAFGHADSSALQELVDAAAVSGAAGLRPAPAHTLLLVGIHRHAAARLSRIARQLGFVIRADDPRCRIFACAGAPACAAAEIPTRTLAPFLASTGAISGANGPMVHVSGCAKGCACPRSMPLTVVGTKGRCGIVVNGSAHEEPVATLLPEALPGALARVAGVVQRMRATDESAAEALSRLGRAHIARLILGETTDA